MVEGLTDAGVLVARQTEAHPAETLVAPRHVDAAVVAAGGLSHTLVHV